MDLLANGQSGDLVKSYLVSERVVRALGGGCVFIRIQKSDENSLFTYALD